MRTSGKVISRIVFALAVLAIFLPSAPASAAFYLHGTGPNANPPTLFLDNTAPAAETTKYRDSAGVRFSGGNPWKEIGTWTVPAAGSLTALNNLHVWLGLKNSDDIGTRFDLRAEVYRNGQSFIASSDTYCIQGITRNASLAKEVIGSFGSFAPVEFSGADTLSLKILARIGTNGSGAFCGGHSNAVGLRLYFDAVSRPSRFTATLSENLPPVANAGVDQNVLTGERATLDGRNSYDPEGALITYAWSLLAAPAGSLAALDNPSSVLPSFTPDLPGTYVSSLVVSDGQSNSLPDNMSVIAQPLNAPPTANAGPDQSVVTGTVTQLDGRGSFDPEAAILSYSWQILSRPAESNAVLDYATTPLPTFLADVSGQYVLQLIVSDGQLNSSPDNVVVVAAVPNAAPVAFAGPDNTVSRNAILRLDGTQSYDPDNDPLFFAWSIVSRPAGGTGVLDNAASPAPSMLADGEGDFVFRLVVNDGQVASPPDTVVVTSVNDPPVANAGPDQVVPVNTVLTLDGSGSHDANGDPLTYLWSIISAPAGSTATIGNPAAVNPLFTPALVGSYILQLVVSDGYVNSAPDTVVITATVPMVPVPNVTGQLQGNAEAAIAAAGLAVGVVTTAPSATVPAGSVISQNPTGGSSAPQGSPVALVVSSGPALVTVPNVVGLPQSTAQAAIAAAGLIVGTVTSASSPSVPAGSIISQTPAGGSSVLLGSPVALVVSSGGPTVPVPDVVGKPQANAQTVVANAGFVVGAVTTAHSDTVLPGGVVSQTPAAGASAAQGSAVALVISLGPAPVTLPPDPVTVASSVDPTVATTQLDATGFLYTGPNPIQTGVAPGTIELTRAAVLRGRVKTRDDVPLPGVTVTILDHPEYGQTITREDGMFDMAANGGGLLTVNYRKGGYLPAQRQVNAPWQDYAWLPEIVMVSFDNRVAAIDLTSPTPVQVAQGNVVNDADGPRQETVLFMQGTQATMTLPDGSSRPLSTLNVRATEYTVGASGPKAMPAELPPTTAYTYCVELSVDEAVAAGATEVTFSQPVITYVENFIGFPVGVPVPVGYYDRKKGIWIPLKDGIVIKILDISGGVAILDTDGDNAADDAGRLASLGITDAERAHLALLYTPGSSLWRAGITHFSPLDKNYPAPPPPQLPLDAITFDQPPRKMDDTECPNTQAGSIIACENQVLGETVPVTGTPYSLNYRSNRVPGRTAENSLEIPITGSTVPQSLRRIDLVIDVAGRRFTSTFPPAPNQSTTFVWDGKDAYGRTLQGQKPVSVRLMYIYPAMRFGSVIQNPSGRSFGGYGGPPYAVLNDAETEFSVIHLWSDKIGRWDVTGSIGLGGWTVSDHHQYDAIDRTIYQGNGSHRRAANMARTIHTVAGNGSGGVIFNGDGIPATDANLNYPLDVVFDAAGNYYIAEAAGKRIRRVDSNGIITTVAGNGQGLCPPAGTCSDTTSPRGDGGPATQAMIEWPFALALGPDGSLYFSDSEIHRVRRVGPDGIITTVAGTGVRGYAGDGGPATQARLNGPVGIDIGKDGSLYIADRSRVRRVGPDGIITTVAGNGVPDYAGDGGYATAAQLDPVGLAVDRSGNLYIGDSYNNRIRKVDPSGIITTVAGNGDWDPYGDGGPATEASFGYIDGVTVGPDGSLYISDSEDWKMRIVTPDGIINTFAGNGTAAGGDIREGAWATNTGGVYPIGSSIGPDGSLYYADFTNIRRVGPYLPGLTVGDTAIASRDGRELYFFDFRGKHQRTVNALTGGLLRQFGYDSSGLPNQITDGDGSVTTIARDGNGKATAIVAPGGQVTSLSLDPNGYLERISGPSGNATQLGNTAGGLLTGLIDPNSNSHAFFYDALGRLERDEDPEGGYTSLIRASTDNGFLVTAGTALGRATTYEVRNLPAGAKQTRKTSPAGASEIQARGADGKITVTLPDGTVSQSTEEPDPRWKMESPVPASTTVRTPGGLVSTTTVTRTATLANPADALSLTAQTDTVNVNGRAYTQVYAAGLKQFTDTTPVGRQAVTAIDNQGRVLRVNIAPAVDNVTFAYDPNGRLAQTGQGGKTWTFGYDIKNRLTSLIDPAEHPVQYGYDTADRVSQVILPSGRTYGFGYDANGNRTSITMPSGAVHGLGYNRINLDNAYLPPNNPAYATGYNLDRQWVRTALPSGRAIDGAYDNGGRMLGMSYPEADVTVSYADNTDRVSSITRAGQDGSSQQLSFTYDGSLPTGVTFAGVANGQYQFIYNNNFFVTGYSLDGGPVTMLGRDADGLLTSHGPFTITRSGPAGAPGALSDGTLNVAYAYDAFGRLATRTHTVAGTPVYQVQMAYDDVGRIRQKIETVSGTPSTYDYTYDLDGQLFEVRRDTVLVEQYGYDNNANRTSTLALSATYDEQDRLLQQAGVNYTFDDDGYLTTRGSDTFAYSARGELLSATVAGQTTTYRYDGLGRRIGRTDASGTYQYLYGNPGNPFMVTASRDTAGVLTTYFYDVSGNMFAFERSGQRYYVATDQLGTPKVVTDSAGNMVKATGYDSWGVKISDSNPSFDLPVGFAGGIAENTTGMVRFGYRDYEPGTGRWAARDPIFFRGKQINLFIYSANDPVDWMDPAGLLAAGVSFEFSTISPFTSGGGGSYGINLEYTSDSGLHWYTYSTPNDVGSTGLLVGPSVQLNFATGTGDWTGPFESGGGSYEIFSGGYFHSPLDQSDPGYFGISFGVGKGLPGVGFTKTVYRRMFPEPTPCK